MSSKSNPIAFRLSKNNISQSQWYAYNNYATILHDDLMIQEMIKYTYQRKFLSWVNQIVIRRTSRGIFIFIYAFTSRDIGIEANLFQIQQLENMIQKYLNIQNQKIQIFSYNYYNLYNLEKNELFSEVSNTFGHLRWLSLQKEFLRLAFVAVYSRNVNAFCNFVGVRLARVKRHKKIIFIVRQLLSEFILFKNDLVGVRIRFKGRLDGKPRAKQMFLQTGHVPLHTISATISYHLTHVYSKYGTFGLRIWLCFTQSNIEFFNQLNQTRLEKIKKENVTKKKQEKSNVHSKSFIKVEQKPYKNKKNESITELDIKNIPNPEIFHSYMITKPSESFDVLKLKESYLQKKQWWFSNQYEIVQSSLMQTSQKIAAKTVNKKQTRNRQENEIKKVCKKTKLNYLISKNSNLDLIRNQNGYVLWLFLNKTNRQKYNTKNYLKILNQLQKFNNKNYYNQIFIDLCPVSMLSNKYNFDYNNLTLTFLNENKKGQTGRKEIEKNCSIQFSTLTPVESSFDKLINLIKKYKNVKHKNKTYNTIISDKINLLKTIKTNSIKVAKSNILKSSKK